MTTGWNIELMYGAYWLNFTESDKLDSAFIRYGRLYNCKALILDRGEDYETCC